LLSLRQRATSTFTSRNVSNKGERVDKAIAGVLAAGKIPDLSAGKCPPTSEIGDMIAGAL